jgi:(p)ppGpp synthase/HD superfamily hydrolase
MAFDFDVVAAARRLEEIRLARRQLEAEEEEIRRKLAELLRAMGGRLVIGSYALSLTSAETFQYKKIVESLRTRHPELQSEIDAVSQEFRTIYERVDVRRL